MEKKKWVDLSKRTQKALSIGAIVVFLLFFFSLLVIVGIPIIKNAKNPEVFRSWIDSMGIWGKLAYVGMNIIQVIVAIIPGGPIEIAGGYAFEHVEATLLCSIGMGIGSILVFLLVRLFGYKLVEVFFSKEKIQELRFLKSFKSRDLLLTILFLIPGTPKDLLSYFCGLTDIPIWKFFLISTFARIPAIWVSSAGGSLLGDKSYAIALLFFALIILCSGIGILIYTRVVNKHKNDEK